jgi:hypothetical protein
MSLPDHVRFAALPHEVGFELGAAGKEAYSIKRTA